MKLLIDITMVALLSVVNLILFSLFITGGLKLLGLL